MRFDSCHPAINLLYFVSVIGTTLWFRHPAFLIVSFLCALAYTAKLNGLKGFVFGLACLPCAAVWTLWYAGYHHFGVTPLRQNFIGNNITLESLVYGGILGLSIAAAAVWFSCVHAVFSADKVVYLFGRISPHLSLFLAILLRMVPRIKAQGKRIHTAQKAIGRGMGQGNLFRRLKNALRILSMLITWTAESFVTSADSMRCRGLTLKGRTAFSIYRFDNRDRAFVVAIFSALTLLAAAVLLRQTWVLYDPRIVLPPVTGFSLIFYGGYALLCLLPLLVQLADELRFAQLRRTAFEQPI